MFNFVRTFLVVTVLALVTGCAGLPSQEEMKAQVAGFTLPKLPEAGKAIVYVVRPSSVGALIRFNVFIDDQEDASEMGYTRGSQYIYFNLKPGKHKIMSKAENWAEAEVDAKAGDIIFIQQEATMGFLMARNSVMSIPDVQGKYHVKNLTLGTIAKADK